MSYQVEVFCDDDLNANTYLVYNETSCIIIDPANNNKVLMRYVDKREVLGILLTHGHYDHFKSLSGLLENYDVLVYMHKNAYLKLSDIDSSYAKMFNYHYPTIIDKEKVRFISDGETLKLGNFVIKCWYTPGHTDCMMSYIIDNNLFSGDFIFKGSIGRTDLLTSSATKMHVMLEELKRRKNNYIIYPGHEASTTLDDEKENNVYLSLNGSFLEQDK